MSDNNVTVIGNVTRDPELRFTASGQATATFGLAVNRKWQNRQTNEWVEQVSFFNIVVWRELAENCAESLRKGSRAIVSGRLEQRSYETPDGEKKSVFEIVADEIGPSLRWATAQVIRNERRGGDGEGGGGGYSNQGNQGNQGIQGNQGNQGGRAPSRPAPSAEPAATYDYDEEPF